MKRQQELKEVFYDVRDERNQALAALKQISKREGPFSLDPHKHAENTIDNMEDLAVTALDHLWPNWRTSEEYPA